jgi:hypothetical protein
MSGDKWLAEMYVKLAAHKRGARTHRELDLVQDMETLLDRVKALQGETRETVSGETRESHYPESHRKPWEIEGISRAAYYRRKRAEADRAGQ